MRYSMAVMYTLSLLLSAVPGQTLAQTERKLSAKEQKALTAYLEDKPAQLQQQFRAVKVEGERNAVLNLLRAGLAAMQMGNDAVAAAAFDEALNRIEVVYADNDQAAKARSKFVLEATKDFKGEPYERAMAYYYRGLLYLKVGDYDNARATFQAAQLQDAFAEDQRYASDYALMEYLAGWASHCQGSETSASEFYGRANAIAQQRGLASMVAPGANDKVLLIAEIGSGPRKVSDGQYQENLRFQPAEQKDRRVVFTTPEIEKSLVDMFVTSQQAAQEAESQIQLVDARVLVTDADAKTALQRLALLEPALPPAADSAAAAPAGAAEAGAAPVQQASASTTAQITSLPTATPGAAGASPGAAGAASAPSSPRGVAAKAPKVPPPPAIPPELVEARLAAGKALLDSQLATATAKAAHDELDAKRAAAKSSAAALLAAGLKAPPPESWPASQPAATRVAFGPDGAAPPAPAVMAPLPGHFGENIYWQAVTRGGREVDGILAGKAQFKESSAQFANSMGSGALTALQMSSSMMQQTQSLAAQGYNVNYGAANAMVGASAVMGVIGLFASVSSKSAKPAADIRYWDNLPMKVDYATAPAATGTYRANFVEADNTTSLTSDVQVVMDSRNACGIGWVRTDPADRIPPSAPNSALLKK